MARKDQPVVSVPHVSDNIVEMARTMKIRFNEPLLRQYANFKIGNRAKRAQTVKVSTLRWWVNCYDHHFNRTPQEDQQEVA